MSLQQEVPTRRDVAVAHVGADLRQDVVGGRQTGKWHGPDQAKADRQADDAAEFRADDGFVQGLHREIAPGSDGQIVQSGLDLLRHQVLHRGPAHSGNAPRRRHGGVGQDA